MLWLKAFHIIFVVTWFAGLFYLPRLYIYHLELDGSDREGHQRFVTMERRLLGITHIGGALAILFGGLLLAWWYRQSPAYLAQGWLHAKLFCVLLLVGYHHGCMRLARAFATGQNRRSSRWLRIYNEVPALLLIVIVLLVVVRPF